jgi:hypothetical protein
MDSNNSSLPRCRRSAAASWFRLRARRRRSSSSSSSTAGAQALSACDVTLIALAIQTACLVALVVLTGLLLTPAARTAVHAPAAPNLRAAVRLQAAAAAPLPYHADAAAREPAVALRASAMRE